MSAKVPNPAPAAKPVAKKKTFALSPRVKRVGARIAAVLVVVWLLACAGLYAAMRQPPDTFGRVMKHVPFPAFFVLPFETLWTSARAGTVRVGDSAPDFNLPTLDKSAHIQLSSFRAAGKPVVLVFGSYT
jgi:hypothetical protein